MSETQEQGQEPLQSTVQWDSTIDTMLATWCDNAKCYEWMHTEASAICDSTARTFMIVINSLTAVSGLSNVIAGGFAVNGFQIAWVFGGISIFASTLNLLQDKLGYQQSAVIHKKLAQQWASVRLTVEEMISIPYSARKDCKTFLKYVRLDINKATQEGSSIIPKDIRLACFDKFNKIERFDIPDICGKMEHTRIFINPTAYASAATVVPLATEQKQLIE
jgi:hypothetical protein